MKARVLKEDRTVKDAVLQVIREIFAQRQIDIEKIVFFGSRVRGDFDKDSDWDFLVIANKELEIKEKHRLIIRIKRELAKMGIPNDIIIQSKSRFDLMKNYPGHISYAANLESVEVFKYAKI
ncbi:MAG: nucleotidyltransferase domain-containing protein [Candidatus Aminicenantes bacterium]|nr:nucleotidyltransferase domain-containing protein [Candidatus Aminicenantes bacterium]